MKRSRKRSEIRNLGAVLLFVLPALIPLFIFWIYPILRSVWLSFTDWDFMTPDYNFIWFKNYTSLLKDSRFYEALWNTLVFTAGIPVSYNCRRPGSGASAPQKF